MLNNLNALLYERSGGAFNNHMKKKLNYRVKRLERNNIANSTITNLLLRIDNRYVQKTLLTIEKHKTLDENF